MLKKSLKLMFLSISMATLVGCPGEEELNSTNTQHENGPIGTETELPPDDGYIAFVYATSIAADAITVGSDIELPGATERGVVYRTNPNPTLEDNKVVASGSVTGPFSVRVSGLTPSTTYYMRAYAMNAERIVYSAEQNFTTRAEGEPPIENAQLPTLSTAGVSHIGSTFATLGGEVLEEGIPAYTERGVCYATTQNPTTANNKVEIPGSGTGEFSQKLEGLTLNTTYYVRAYAISAAGTVYGAQQSFTTASDLHPPAAPTELTATAVSPTQINLSWKNHATNARGYIVEFRERKINMSDWAEIAKLLSANATSYQSTDLKSVTGYEYRVRAFNGAGDSDYSNVAITFTRLHAPTNLTATVASSTQINLHWQSYYTRIQIERSTDKNNWTEIADNDREPMPNLRCHYDYASCYNDTGLTPGTTYYYRARFRTDSQYSDYSNMATATAQTPATVPAAPSDLDAWWSGGTLWTLPHLKLSWKNNATNQTGYSVEVSENGGVSWRQLDSSLSFPSYQVSLDREKTYQFRVRAFNGGGNSGPSNVAHVRPDSPINLTATVVSSSQINLHWHHATGATSYSVYYYAEPRPFGVPSPRVRIFLASTTANTFQDTGLDPETSYFYYVVPHNAAGDGMGSSVSTTTHPVSGPPPEPPPPPPPPVSPSSITVSPSAFNVVAFNSLSSQAHVANTAYPNSSTLAVGNDFYVNYLGTVTSYNLFGSALKFDIQSQISGRSIRRAELRLHISAYPASSSSYRLKAFASPWDRNTLTWNSIDRLQAYSDSTVNVPQSFSSPMVINITNIVQSWASGRYQNHGVYLSDPNLNAPRNVELRRTEFHNMSHSNAALRPSLYIEFQ